MVLEINLYRERKTLLLCTPKTAKQYKSNEYLMVVPLPLLAKDVERNAFNLERINIARHLNNFIESLSKVSSFDKLTTLGCNLTTEKLKLIFDHQINYFDAVIMGCTHYFFIKDKIFNHFQPQVLIGGEYFTARKVKFFLEQSKTFEKTKRKSILFFGKDAYFNASFFKSFSNYNSKNIIIL